MWLTIDNDGVICTGDAGKECETGRRAAVAQQVSRATIANKTTVDKPFWLPNILLNQMTLRNIQSILLIINCLVTALWKLMRVFVIFYLKWTSNGIVWTVEFG
jgi:hypothetical protein